MRSGPWSARPRLHRRESLRGPFVEAGGRAWHVRERPIAACAFFPFLATESSVAHASSDEAGSAEDVIALALAPGGASGTKRILL